MTDETVTQDVDASAEDHASPKKLSGKKLVLFILLPILVLGGGAFFMLGGDSKSSDHAAVAAKGEHGSKKDDGHGSAKGDGHGDDHGPSKTGFYDLPEMIVNLNSTGRRPSFLKIKVSLELANEADISHLDSVSPRIIDNFQVYLRELRIDDLRGSAGIYRLREELLARVATAARPAKIKNVLFKEVLVQ